MTHEPAPGRGHGSGRLWTDPREEQEHQPWLAPRRAILPVEPLRDSDPEPPEEPRGAGLWPLILIATLVAAVLFGAGVLGANLLFSNDGAATPAALPVSPGAAPADSRSKAIRAVYAKASPSVVSVRAREGSGLSGGTGFVIDRGGTIVTNAHVVAGASNVQVRLDDHGDPIEAQVLGTDASSDLAVLRASGAASSLRPLVLADSNEVQVGDLAVAIGYPLGLDRAVTAGIVSGVGRAIRAPNGFQIDKVIQTDAPINPGNSGGPLLDSAGRVIGVNAQIATASGAAGNIGIGFAVPSNTVRVVVPRLERGGSIKRAYLGVTTLASTVNTGALVNDVAGGGPADSGGVQTGDIIVKVDGEDVGAPEDVSTAIEGRKPGDEVEVEVQRAGGRKTLHVTLGTRPENLTTTP